MCIYVFILLQVVRIMIKSLNLSLMTLLILLIFHLLGKIPSFHQSEATLCSVNCSFYKYSFGIFFRRNDSAGVLTHSAGIIGLG